jgi:enoyl-CoA hydratase/carnithine racemase
MSTELMLELRERIAEASRDETVRVIVLTGAGSKAFSAGADLSMMTAGEGAIAGHDARGVLADVFRRLWISDKPSIARVQGYALAGGFGLALACDFVVASSDAQFGAPEVDVGLWPYMITVPLLRSMPARFALELMATGRRIDSAEAQRIGFVNRVVSAADLDSTVDELAQTLASKSPLILKLGRRSFYRALEMSSDTALDYLQGMLTITLSSGDTAEGVRAFGEKRAPKWLGR